ncbi:protein ELYS-like isoform X4 [Orbicella faveolata]|uniref:protein ELYS-like isoform X4 n=1 Tax=Orbicella faveolata TaxID=48498 RepID=UPI0009E5CA66|nr:protein ELYS-like isoform X4 [Orbicella faveolata]
MHYLQKGRYVEGIRLNELLKKDKKSQQDEQAKVRNALVDGYIRCLPRVQRKLVFGPDKPLSRQPITLTEVPRPKPLSTVVHRVDKGNPVSRAVILSSTMDKVEELRSVEQSEPQQEAEAFVCTPVTPRIKSKLSDSNKVGVVFASVTKRPSEDVVVSKQSPVTEKRTSPRTVTSPTFLDKRSRRQFFSGAEALSLLATPPVVKVKPMAGGSSVTKPEAVNIATPQSILKITRVLRRSSPQPSPTSSPPTTRRGSSDQLSKSIETRASDSASQREELTPGRRIRFASENVSSSPSTSPIKQLDVSTPVFQEETVDSPAPSNISGGTDGMEVSAEPMTRQHTSQILTDLQAEVQEATIVTHHEEEEVDDQGEAELQITAAVMDLTGDSDIEEAEPHDEDYNSYELDDSDAVLDAESDDESAGDSSVQPQISSVTVHQTADTSAQLFPVSEQPSSPEKTISSLVDTKESPYTTLEPVPDNSATLPARSPIRSPEKQPSPPDAPSLVFSQKQSLSVEQERISEVSHHTPLEANQLYTFSPPAVLQPPGTHGESNTTTSQVPTTPSLEYFFSPPLTRSMARRRSSGMTPTDTYGSREGFRKPTPHQSPSNSPISFVSPVPQPGSSPRSSRKKVVRLPMHSMTLRARKCPGRPTRAAKLPHTKL